MLTGTFLSLFAGALIMLRLGPGAGSFPRPLSAREERECVDRWLAGDIEARNKLIEHNLRLVAHIIKKYYTRAEDADDLISIGTIGLIKGVNTYRPDKGVRLATYASKCTENEILMQFRRERKTALDVSLSESIDTDGEGNALSLMDVLAQEDDMAEELSHAETCRGLKTLVDSALTGREAEIIRLRYGLVGDGPLTQREVAELCGISRSYVSRIEKRALEKLREILGEPS